MSKVLKSLIIIFTLLPVFLDVISPSESCKRSCRNYEKDPITVYIYDYNGEVYNQVTSQTNIYKNTLLNFIIIKVYITLFDVIWVENKKYITK